MLRNFRRVSAIEPDAAGYLPRPEDNLTPGFNFDAVEEDIRQGDGNELGKKFRAIHSSCALGVNSFGIFKAEPQRLHLCDINGATKVRFEKKLPIFMHGTAPNIDIWIRNEQQVIAVESKLIEYLSKRVPNFSGTYNDLKEDCDKFWWSAYLNAGEKALHLDWAQLVKHYFGLNRFQRGQREASPIGLLYIFWEPLNWRDVPECIQHRDELLRFEKLVSGSQICFSWTTYNDLWEQWSAQPDLREHSEILKARYQTSI